MTSNSTNVNETDIPAVVGAALSDAMIRHRMVEEMAEFIAIVSRCERADRAPKRVEVGSEAVDFLFFMLEFFGEEVFYELVCIAASRRTKPKEAKHLRREEVGAMIQAKGDAFPTSRLRPEESGATREVIADLNQQVLDLQAQVADLKRKNNHIVRLLTKES